MLTISSMASIDYYLKDSEELGATDKKTLRNKSGDKKGGYYEGNLKDGDPLKRPLRVHGSGALALGLKPGQVISSDVFRELYFGCDPATGKPLMDGMPSKAEQDAAQKSLSLLEKKLDLVQAERDFELAEAIGRQNGNVDAAMDDPKFKEADRVYETVKKELDSARNSGDHRRAGTDLVFSLPPDMNLIHASLLANGRFDEARRMEEAFKMAVDQACDELGKLVTSSSGRSDRDGIPGEPVECVWFEATHFDARPDPNDVVSHNLHLHRGLFNLGRTADGRYVPVRTEELEKHREAVDGVVLAKMTAYCVRAFGADPTATEYKKGVLGVRFGGTRALASLKIPTQFFGRAAQIKKNLAEGASPQQAKMKGRKQKIDGWDAERHIAMQREMLEASGLDFRAICGDRKERERVARYEAEQMLITEYANEEKRWLKYLGDNYGFPNGKPQPFKGEDASDWIAAMKEIAQLRKTKAGDSIPKRPARPPGHPEYKEKTWRERIDFEAEKRLRPHADRMSLDPEKIVAHVSQIDPSFTPQQLRSEIARRVAVQPAETGFLGALSGLANRLKSDEQLMRDVERKIERIYKSATHSQYVMESRHNGRTVFVAQDQREAERELYGKILPDLLKADPKNVRAMSKDDAARFIKEWEAQQGFPFSEQQRKTLTAIATSQTRAQASIGWAGSGKSAQARAAREILNRLGYRVIAVAPSHAATSVLVGEIGAAVGYCPEGLLGALVKGKETIGPGDVVFLDEASMLALKSGAEVLRIIHKNGGRIIFSGDPAQLASVGAGDVLNKFLELAQEAEEKDGIVRTVRMNEVYTDMQTVQRQKLRVGKAIAAEAEITDVANTLRSLAARGMVEIASDEKTLIERMSAEYAFYVKRDLAATATPDILRELRAAKKSGDKELIALLQLELEDSLSRTKNAYDQTVLLAETNAAVDDLSRNARKTLKSLGVLDTEDVKINGSRGAMQVAVGERLVLRGKIGTKDALAVGDDEDGGSFEFNKSTLLTVVEIGSMRDGSPVLKCKLDKPNEHGVDTILIPAERFSDLAYAYSRTVHLSQGMTAKNALYMPSKNSRAELFLVGVTRFTDNLKVFFDGRDFEAIKTAIGRQQRKLSALDYDELSSGTVEDVVERVESEARRGSELDKAVADAREGALDVARASTAKASSELSPVAQAIKSAAMRDKRTDLEKAARLGVSTPTDGLPKFSKDKRSWLAVYSETRDHFNPDTSRFERRETEYALAYNPKTGRLEEWPATELDEQRLTLARRSALGSAVRDSIRDAKEPGKDDIKGVLVGTGIAPLRGREGAKATHWAKVEDAEGKITTVWGADVGRAIKEGGFKVGDGIALNGDERVDAEVFAAKPIPGGTGKHKGEIVSMPVEGKTGVVRLDDGRDVRVSYDPSWSGLKEGARVDVHSKKVDRRVWKATSVELESAIPLENRHRAFRAVERAIGDAALFERLRAVGAGTKIVATDAETDERKRAIRTLKADGDGYRSVVDWNASTGKTGRKAWHEAGYLVKEGDKALASLSCVSVLDDGERVYYAVAVQNNRTGDVEAMSTRILAFSKKDLGLTADVAPGTAHEILVEDGSNIPVLKGEWGGMAATTKTTAQELAEERERLLAQKDVRAAESAAFLDELIEESLKLPADAIPRRPSEQKPTRAGGSLRDAGSLKDAERLFGAERLLKVSDAERQANEAIREAAESAKKEISKAAESIYAQVRRQEVGAVSQEWARKQNEASQVEATAELRLTPRQIREQALETARKNAEKLRLAEEKARENAKKELEKLVAKNTQELARLDDADANFEKMADDLIERGVVPHASNEAFGNVLTLATKKNEKEAQEILEELWESCPEDRRDRLEALLVAGIDPKKAEEKKYPIELLLEKYPTDKRVVAAYLDAGGDPYGACGLGVSAVDIVSNMPCSQGDRLADFAKWAGMSDKEISEALSKAGADGKTLKQRALELEASGDFALSDALHDIRSSLSRSLPEQPAPAPADPKTAGRKNK